MNIALTFGIAILGISILILLRKYVPNFNIKLTLKILAVVYFTICFAKVFFSDGFIWVINSGFYGGVYYDRYDVLQTILRWGMYAQSGIITVAVFTKVKTFKNIAIYLCVPFTILATCFFGDFIEYYMDGTGRGINAGETIRAIILMIELVLAIIIPVIMRICEGVKFDVKNKYEWINFFGILPLLLISMFPVYTIQSLFGETGIIVGPFKLVTIIWMIFTVGLILVLIRIFRGKSYDQKYALCLWLCIALFMHYNSLYLMGFSIKRLPIQLCNLGAYFFIVCVIIKNQAFFNFTFIANITGTIIAMMIPDIEGGIGYFWNIHFMLEHMLVLIVPSVMMGVGLFQRVDKKSIKHVFIGYCIYFAVCLISGVVLNIFSSKIDSEVNFFYLFDPKIAMSLVSPTSFVFNWQIVINGFTFYPLYIMGVFIVFGLLMLLFYGLVRLLYQIDDDREEIRNNRGEFISHLKNIVRKKEKTQNVEDKSFEQDIQ